jgi:hypothetical protein
VISQREELDIGERRIRARSLVGQKHFFSRRCCCKNKGRGWVLLAGDAADDLKGHCGWIPYIERPILISIFHEEDSKSVTYAISEEPMCV